MHNPFSDIGELRTEHYQLRRTIATDLEPLFAVASDPEIWAQHPESDRWRREKFEAFFDGALANSVGSFTIVEKSSASIIGSTRFYGYQSAPQAVRIGYTFIAKCYWGSGANREIKMAMLSLAFDHVDRVYFDIGADNNRSRRAVEKLGAVLDHITTDRKAVYALSKDTLVLG